MRFEHGRLVRRLATRVHVGKVEGDDVECRPGQRHGRRDASRGGRGRRRRRGRGRSSFARRLSVSRMRRIVRAGLHRRTCQPSSAKAEALAKAGRLLVSIHTCRFMDMDTAARLRLLGDETRLRLLAAAVARIPQCLGADRRARLAQSGVSRHLGLLRDAGLVAEERAGAFTWYRLSAGLRRGQRRPRRRSGPGCARSSPARRRRRARTTRGWRKCGGCARRTFAHARSATSAGSSCRAGAGRPGRARSGCCCRPWTSPTSDAAKAT